MGKWTIKNIENAIAVAAVQRIAHKVEGPRVVGHTRGIQGSLESLG